MGLHLERMTLDRVRGGPGRASAPQGRNVPAHFDQQKAQTTQDWEENRAGERPSGQMGMERIAPCRRGPVPASRTARRNVLARTAKGEM